MTTTLDEAMRRAAEAFHNVITPVGGTLKPVEAMQAALASLARDGFVLHQGWQPIETAPTDNEAILVTDARGVVGEARHIPDEGWYWAGEDPGDYHADPFQPTRWMPLPAAPKVGGSDDPR